MKIRMSPLEGTLMTACSMDAEYEPFDKLRVSGKAKACGSDG
jgi:hypothetical protein